MSTYAQERLIDEACRYLKRGEPIPMDVAANLMLNGVIVEELEQQYQEEEENYGQ